MNPDGQMKLSDSVKLVGLCPDMCPEFERVRRIVQSDFKRPECVRTASPHVERDTNIRKDARNRASRLQRPSARRIAHGESLHSIIGWC
jgi:hypothetical protein